MTTPMDKWSEGWAQEHAQKLSVRALEVTIEVWEDGPKERVWGKGRHLEILREELARRSSRGAVTKKDRLWLLGMAEMVWARVSRRVTVVGGVELDEPDHHRGAVMGAGLVLDYLYREGSLMLGAEIQEEAFEDLGRVLVELAKETK